MEVSVYYSKGGVSFYNNRVIPRGYYLSVKPVTKGDGMISHLLFTGRSHLLLETQRFSVKQFARAVDMAKDCEAEIISAVVAENKAA